MEQQNAGAPAARPTFLTVLCILSWIWQGIMAVLLIIAMLAIGVVTAAVNTDAVQDEMSDLAISDPSVADAMNTVASASSGMLWAAVVVGFLCLILQFVGVLRMWKLKKSGFYLYSAAFVISAIMSFVAGDYSTFGLVIGAGFVAMYAANLKSMS